MHAYIYIYVIADYQAARLLVCRVGMVYYGFKVLGLSGSDLKDVIPGSVYQSFAQS